MNITTTDTRSTRIAVFIDFDNVEIGVKSTIGGQFDIGLVLEAIKERGEIVTKIAYSDWKRAGDYSRLLTQHAIRMVQRNLTPGGDKNGADITMALDALEMAFTHDHINAFVIVGGDSDFISLVEKLKQYGRKVIVVGGRQFTSATMQRNCHEFIAYENLVGSRGGRQTERSGRAVTGTSDISKALPLVKRALKVLSEREVTPQLGLLKSTLLQLDSTFSEREYGVSSFRDFMEKVAQAGAVTLKHAGRSMLVEQVEDGVPAESQSTAAEPSAEAPPPEGPPNRLRPSGREATRHQAALSARSADADRAGGQEGGHDEGDEDEQMPVSPMSLQDGIRAVQRAFSETPPARWPLYVRQAKQHLRSAIDGFDERKYGFASVVDLLRAAGKEGVLKVERDRQGAIRLFPGVNLAAKSAVPVEEPEILDVEDEVYAPVPEAEIISEPVADPPILDGEAVLAADVPVAEPVEGEKPARRRRTSTRAPKAAKTARAPRPRARKSVAKSA
ncbi:MAG TPA: NYN domain-containing protein [Vicinamibacterales bacterium]|nr:NYN domain-containing protein [Vicinamibacterales bacterium]